MILIENKKALAAHLDSTPTLAEFRDALEDEWPEVRKELLKQVWRMDPRPPPYGSDWEAWLKAHLDEAAEEAASIVL